MEDTQATTLQHPIHWGHVGAILLCAVTLIGITFMRNGFHFAPLSSNSSGSTLTYEKARQLADAQNPDIAALANGNSNLASSDDATSQQIAMIDPSSQGSVLGASTGTPDLSQDKINQVPIKALGYTSAQAVQKYVGQVSAMEDSYGSFSLLGNFSSGDEAGLRENEKTISLIINSLYDFSVPSDLETYHKLKLLYYSSLQSMTQMKLGEIPDDQFPQISNMLFGLMNQINNIRIDIQAKYQITLP